MTRYDQNILFTALSFIAIVGREHEKLEAGGAQKVMQLAGLLSEFCVENVPPIVQKIELGAGVEEAELDFQIARHVHELRSQHETHLPEKRPALLKLYDRLQQRKSWRMHQDFYAQVTTETLADLVLNLLSEEIDNVEGAS